MLTLSLYDGKYQLEFNEGTHRYKVNGDYKQGVTTTLGVLAKDGLIQWAANMVTNHIRDHCEIAGEGYLVTEDDLKDAKYAHAKKRDDSADIGSRVHAWCEAHISGRDLVVDADMQPSVDAFLRWETNNHIEYLFTEKVVYSEQYEYCGTFDVAFVKDGKRYLADFKTSDTDKEYSPRLRSYTGLRRARGEHLLQCAAYDQAYTEEYGEGFDAYMVIYLTKEGELFTFETDRTNELKGAFLSVLNTYRQIKDLDKTTAYQ